MSLRDTIMARQKQAMKDKDQETLDTLRMLWSTVRNEEMNAGDKETDVLNDERILGIIRRTIKQLKDARQDFVTGGRTDLIEKTDREVARLSEYLPAEMTDDELKAIVTRVIAATGATSQKDLGRVMGGVVSEARGRADGNRIRALVQTSLPS